MPALPTILCALAAGAAPEVVLSGPTWALMVPPEEPEPEPAPDPLVASREVVVTPDGDAVRVTARWRVRAPRAGAAVEWILAGPELRVDRATVDGRPAPVSGDPRGTVLAMVLDGDARLEVSGTIAADPARGGSVRLLAAGAGTVTAPADWRVGGALAVGPGRAVGGTAALSFGPAPGDRAVRPTLVIGEAAVGVTVGDADVAVAARVRFRVADGEIDRVAFAAPGAGVDLVVRGPQVGSWTRSGDRVEVVLLRPERSLVALEASWTLPAPQGESARLAVPEVRPEGVFRTESALQVARDGSVDVVPEVPGWQAKASSQLPDWARGLVQGVPTAAYVGGRGGAGALLLYRFTPAEGPATLVDVAQYTLAATDEGRLLLRAHLAVRNDRGAALRIEPPPGFTPIGVRVAGDTATVARDGRAWRVPLAKSVETVEGLLTFPVEVAFLGEDRGWARRERRAIPLPAIDAEVAVTRVTLHLPPGYRNRLKSGEHDVVDGFTEGSGITYGFAVGDARAAQADALFQGAVSAWLSNEFDQAQAMLDELGAIGASNEDIGRLQSNLALVGSDDDEDEKRAAGREAPPATDAEDVLARRVKEQARARAQDEVLVQEKAVEEAESAYAAGDYTKAEQAYGQALAIGKKLGKLSNAEDEAQRQLNVELEQKLDKTRSTSTAKASAEEMSGKAEGVGTFGGVPEAPRKGVAYDRTVDIDFDSVDVSGEFVAPEASVTEEFLDAVPIGRDYQSAVQTGSGMLGAGEGAKVPSGGAAGGSTAEYLGEPTPEPLPAPPQAVEVAASRAPGVRLPDFRGPGKSKDKTEALPDAARPAEKPAVTASALSVVVPTQGEPVLYQHLLLPAGATWEIPVDARHRRNDR